MTYLKHKPGSLEESVMKLHEKKELWFVKNDDGKIVYKGTKKGADDYLKNHAGSHVAYADGHEFAGSLNL
jgi:hypothetical protein